MWSSAELSLEPADLFPLAIIFPQDSVFFLCAAWCPAILTDIHLVPFLSRFPSQGQLAKTQRCVFPTKCEHLRERQSTWLVQKIERCSWRKNAPPNHHHHLSSPTQVQFAVILLSGAGRARSGPQTQWAPSPLLLRVHQSTPVVQTAAACLCMRVHVRCNPAILPASGKQCDSAGSHWGDPVVLWKWDVYLKEMERFIHYVTFHSISRNWGCFFSPLTFVIICIILPPEWL